MEKLNNKLDRVLKYTQCIEIWLFDKGEFKILVEYDSYVKNMIKSNFYHIKTLSEWLSDTNCELFAEYDKYIESIIHGVVKYRVYDNGKWILDEEPCVLTNER